MATKYEKYFLIYRKYLTKYRLGLHNKLRPNCIAGKLLNTSIDFLKAKTKESYQTLNFPIWVRLKLKFPKIQLLGH